MGHMKQAGYQYLTNPIICDSWQHFTYYNLPFVYVLRRILHSRVTVQATHLWIVSKFLQHFEIWVFRKLKILQRVLQEFYLASWGQLSYTQNVERNTSSFCHFLVMYTESDSWVRPENKDIIACFLLQNYSKSVFTCLAVVLFIGCITGV